MINYPDLILKELRKGSIKDPARLELYNEQSARLSWPSKSDFSFLESSSSSPKDWVAQSKFRILETSKKLATKAVLENKDRTLLELPLDWLQTLLVEGSLLSTKDAMKLSDLAGVSFEVAKSDALGPKDPTLEVKQEEVAAAVLALEEIENSEEPIQMSLPQRAEIVKVEMQDLLRKDQSGLGNVFRIYETGITSPTEICEAGGAASGGSASNQVSRIKALLSGHVPNIRETKKRLISSIPHIITSNPKASPELRSYLFDLHTHTKELQAAATPAVTKKTNPIKAERVNTFTTRKESSPVGKANTLEIYSLPLPEGIEVGAETALWLKLGRLDANETLGLPGELQLLRSYSHKSLTLLELDGEFRRIMTRAEVPVSDSLPIEQGWYRTTLGNLDRIISVLGGVFA